MKSPHNGQNGHHQKYLQTINAGECVEKREPSCTIGGNINWYSRYGRQSGCCCSVIQLCPALCHPLDWSTPGFPVLHHLLEFAQTDVHWVGDAIQPSHPLSSPFPPAFNLSQHQSFPMSWLFASGGQSTGASASAPVLPMNIQDWFPLRLTGLISLQSKGLSRVSSNTTVQKHQSFSTQPSLRSNSHIHTWLLEKP